MSETSKKKEYETKKASEKHEGKDRHSGDHKTGVKQSVKKDGGGGKFTMGKSTHQDCPEPDNGDPNYDSEGDAEDKKEETKVAHSGKGDPNNDSEGDVEEKKEETKAAHSGKSDPNNDSDGDAEVKKEETKTAQWEGTCAGKYQWDDSSKAKGDADQHNQGEAITKYGWSNGKKQVSIYIELDGLDDVADDSFTFESGEKEVSLTIASIGGKRRRFALTALSNKITDVKLQRKKGKNTVVLKLAKKEEQPWFALLAGTSGGGDDDIEDDDIGDDDIGDDDDGGGRGMGGMDMANMLGGMGGGGMASMLGGMGI